MNLLKKTGSHRLLCTQSTLTELIRNVKAELTASNDEPAYDVTIEEIPGLNVLYPKLATETANDPFEPYSKASYAKPDDDALILHSSGQLVGS